MLTRILQRLFRPQETIPVTPTKTHDMTITLILGNIVEQDVDAIINAADWTMLGGTGVDGAIHSAAGPALGLACRKIGRIKTAQAVITPGFSLKARHIIHTVAPLYVSSQFPNVEISNRELLGCAYRSCIQVALKADLTSIAFPALGAGAFGWDIDVVAETAARIVSALPVGTGSLREIRFVAFTRRSFEAYRNALGVDGIIERDPATLRYHPGCSAIS